MSNLVRYTGSGDWSALYVDGELVRVGDHYLIDEKIAELCEVDEYQSDDFMQGGNERSDAAKTLDELHQYQENALKETREAQAQRLREQAAEMLAQADKLSPES